MITHDRLKAIEIINAAPKQHTEKSNWAEVKLLIIDNEVRSYTFDNFYTAVPVGVRSIGLRAFRKSSLRGITLPDTVTNIGGYSFEHCELLSCITLPESVTTIKGSAFKGCGRLTSLTIPRGVKKIGREAFARCGITSVTLPDKLKKKDLGKEVFLKCRDLTSIKIPNSWENVGVGTFMACDGLTSVTLPLNLIHVDDHSFSCCSNYVVPCSPATICVSSRRRPDHFDFLDRLRPRHRIRFCPA